MPFFLPQDLATPGSIAGGGAGSWVRPGGRGGRPDAARGGLQPGGCTAIAYSRLETQETEAMVGRASEVPLPDSLISTYSQRITWWRWSWCTPQPSSAHGGQWIRLLDPPDQWTARLRFDL